MANTNSIVVAAIDSEYFAIIFAKRDRCCRGRHLYLYLYLVDIHRCFVDAPPLMRRKRA